MKVMGGVKAIDELGRIVIPGELRRKVGLEPRDKVEIFAEKDRIVLRKYDPGCVFCGSSAECVEWKGNSRVRQRIDQKAGPLFFARGSSDPTGSSPRDRDVFGTRENCSGTKSGSSLLILRDPPSVQQNEGGSFPGRKHFERFSPFLKRRYRALLFRRESRTASSARRTP